jgi:hypothetical protein
MDQVSSVFLVGDLLSLVGNNTHVLQYEAIYNSKITAENNGGQATIFGFLMKLYDDTYWSKACIPPMLLLLYTQMTLSF